MTAYVTIADSDIDPDSPLTTSLLTALRDNPTAITEGSAGAPNIQLSAMAANSVGASQIVDGSVGSAEIGVGAVGTSEVADDSLLFGTDFNKPFTAYSHLFTTATETFTLPIGVYQGFKFAARGTSGLNEVGSVALMLWDGIDWETVASFSYGTTYEAGGFLGFPQVLSTSVTHAKLVHTHTSGNANLLTLTYRKIY